MLGRGFGGDIVVRIGPFFCRDSDHSETLCALCGWLSSLHGFGHGGMVPAHATRSPPARQKSGHIRRASPDTGHTTSTHSQIATSPWTRFSVSPSPPPLRGAVRGGNCKTQGEALPNAGSPQGLTLHGSRRQHGRQSCGTGSMQ